MQVNAINSLGMVNFEGKKNKNTENTTLPQQHPVKVSKGFMDKVKGPALAVMFLPLGLLSSCEKDYYVSADAEATVEINGSGGSDSNSNDSISNDTIANDTITNDTIPATTIDFPYDMTDSLYTWVNDYLDIPVDGSDGTGSDGTGATAKYLNYLYGERNWNYDQPESITLNLTKSKGNTDAAYYEHLKDNSVTTDLSISKVKSGDITIVKKDGTETSDITGLLIEEEGTKTFMHSNGKDRIYIYPQSTSGKYEELGYIEHGYLYNSDGTEMDGYGQNIALYDILAEGTEDHYINVEGKALTADEIQEMLKEE